MTFVPYVPLPVPPSPRTQELSRRLQAVVESFRQENPEVSAAEIRAALELAKGRGAPQLAVFAVVLGLVACGLLAFLFVTRISSGGGTPVLMAALVAVGIVAIAVALLLKGR